jgi:FixJ family two-component response regulator
MVYLPSDFDRYRSRGIDYKGKLTASVHQNSWQRYSRVEYPHHTKRLSVLQNPRDTDPKCRKNLNLAKFMLNKHILHWGILPLFSISRDPKETMAALKRLWIYESAQHKTGICAEHLSGDAELRQFKQLDRLLYELNHNENPPSMLLFQLDPSETKSLEKVLDDDGFRENQPRFVVTSPHQDLDFIRWVFKKGAMDFLPPVSNPSHLIKELSDLMSSNDKDSSITDNRLDLSARDYRVRYRGKSSDQLTKREFQIFSCFLNRFPETITRDYVMENVWENTCVGKKTFDVHLVNLRKKLKDINLTIGFKAPNQFFLEFEGQY